jgi:hypothetical protein
MPGSAERSLVGVLLRSIGPESLWHPTAYGSARRPLARTRAAVTTFAASDKRPGRRRGRVPPVDQIDNSGVAGQPVDARAHDRRPAPHTRRRRWRRWRACAAVACGMTDSVAGGVRIPHHDRGADPQTRLPRGERHEVCGAQRTSAEQRLDAGVNREAAERARGRHGSPDGTTPAAGKLSSTLPPSGGPPSRPDSTGCAGGRLVWIASKRPEVRATYRRAKPRWPRSLHCTTWTTRGG